MFERLKKRYIIYFAALIVLFGFLAGSLYILTVKGQGNYSISTGSTVTVPISEARGSIYDVNGVLLAYDTVSYDVEFYRDPANSASSDRANYTQILIKAIEIIEANGDTTIDVFMIEKNESGAFVYDLSDALDEETRTKRIETWCSNMQVEDATMDPEDVYYELRSRYRIPESMEYEQARKLLSIWQEVQLGSYQSYIPITIATNVSFETISTLETNASDLAGIDVVSSYTRVYSKNDTAAHVIGYLGKMVDEEEIAEKKELGYSADDIVGKVGIEATMEAYLSGNTSEKQGEKAVELDPNGSVISEAVTEGAEQGDSVVLTLDIGLQEAAEEALTENIGLVYKEQQRMYQADRTDYDKLLSERSKDEIDFIESGAAIVMEINTGKVLALVSEPSYDLNLFTGGISEEEYQALLDTPGSPLFNNAISSTATPGSIFKMATAVGGLMEKVITINTLITDEGPYDKYITGTGVAPECWIRPNFYLHGTQNVTLALKNSCNYFFFEVADRLGIDRLTEWAGKLGLTSKTNIELTSEAIGWIGGQDVLYNSTKAIDEQKTNKPLLVYQKLLTQLAGFGEERGVEYTKEQLSDAALALIKLTSLSSFSIGPEIREVLSVQLDIPENVSLNRGWTSTIMDTIRELIWTATDTVTQGIGATPTQLTPIAVARYMCAIANGGKVYEAHIVDKIIDSEGNIVKDVEPTLVEDLALPEEIYTAIMEGMEKVVSLEDGGTAGSAFENFEYQDIIAGKTGTAPISNIDIEDNVWLCLVAPKEDPEIAVVVFLPNGYSTSKAYPTAKAIISYYFNAKEAENDDTLEEGMLIN